MAQLISGESALERRLGVELTEPRVVKVVNLAEPPGAVIAKVAPSSIAATLNLRPGDVILAVGSDRLKTLAQVRQVSQTLRRGHQYVLRVRRGPKWYTMVFQF